MYELFNNEHLGTIFPHFLPHEGGSRSVLFETGRPTQIVAQNLDTGSRDVLTAGARAVYSPTGHVVYQAGGRFVEGLWALPFSPETLKATGEPFPINARTVRLPAWRATEPWSTWKPVSQV